MLLPYRNAGATLGEALDSVLAQRGGMAFEVLAVDDGSTDDGPAQVARAAARHGNVVPLATGGVGIARALSFAAGHARAPFLARMDGDDVCHPDRLAAQLDAMRTDETLGALGTRVEAFGAVAEGMLRFVDWQNSLVTANDHARQLFVEAPLCHPSVMLRRDALEAAGGYQATDGPEDYELWLRLDAHGFGLAKLPDVLLRWRHLSGRLTFADPRYAIERFRDAKAPHLARRVRALGRPMTLWGAGQTGKRTARALEPHGVRAVRFIDIDPLKIGGRARGVPIVDPTALRRGEHTVVVAVGARGARDLIRTHLDQRGFEEGSDYLCAS